MLTSLSGIPPLPAPTASPQRLTSAGPSQPCNQGAFSQLFAPDSQPADQSSRLKEALSDARLVDEADCILLYLTESLDLPFKAKWRWADRTEEVVEVEATLGVGADGVLLRVSPPELPPGDDTSSDCSYATSSHGASTLSPGALADGSRAAPAHQLYAADPQSIEAKVLDDHRVWRGRCCAASAPALLQLLEDLNLYKHGSKTWPPLYEDVLSEFRKRPSFASGEDIFQADDPGQVRAEVRARYLGPDELPPEPPEDYTATLFLPDSRARLARVIPPRTPLRNHVRCLHRYFASALAFPFVAAWRDTHVWVCGLRPPSALGLSLSAAPSQSSRPADLFPVPAHELRCPAEARDSVQARVLSDYLVWHHQAILVPRERLDEVLADFDGTVVRDPAALTYVPPAPSIAAVAEAARLAVETAAAAAAAGNGNGADVIADHAPTDPDVDEGLAAALGNLTGPRPASARTARAGRRAAGQGPSAEQGPVR